MGAAEAMKPNRGGFMPVTFGSAKQATVKGMTIYAQSQTHMARVEELFKAL